MGIRKNLNKNPFSLFFIMMMIVMISVSAGFSFFYYNVYNKATQNEVITKRASELRASEQYMDNLFTAITRQMNSIIYTKEIYTWNDSDSDYEEYHAVMNVLKDNKVKHSAIHSIYAVFEGSGIVLTSNEGYFSIEKFYDDTWTYYGVDNMQFLKENDRVAISEAHRLSPRSLNGANVVSLVSEIRDGLSAEGKDNNSRAYLVVNLSLNKIIQTMDAKKWDDTTGEEEIAIVSKNNSLIYDSTNGLLKYFSEEELQRLKSGELTYLDKKINGQTYLCQKNDFENVGWYILRISKMTDLATSVVLAQQAMSIAVAIGIAAIAFMLVLIWKRVYQPYARLVEKVRKGDIAMENVDSMEYLEELIARTLDTKEMLMESYFERILLRGYKQSEEPDSKIISLGRFTLLLVSVKRKAMEQGHMVANVQMTALKSCLKQYILEEQKEIPVKECYCIGMADQRMAMILETKEQVEEYNLELYLQMLPQYIVIHRNIEVILGASTSHSGAEEMHAAYLEAKDALGIYYFHQERNVFYFEKTCSLKREFYIENSVKVDIFTNNLYGMRIEEAKEALDIIISDLQKELESVIYYNLPNFFSRIFERVYRAVRNIGLDPKHFFSLTPHVNEQYFNTWEFDSMEEAVKTLYEMLDKIQEYQNEQGSVLRKGNKQWAKIMLEYVEENYNKGISLASMAEDLKLDESYLSKQFKEKVGVSFIQYVTKCRMDKAKELLKDPSVKLADIAENVGMGNVQSFIRTFKKYEGMTPGQYRESSVGGEKAE